MAGNILRNGLFVAGLCILGWTMACEARPLRVVTSFPPSMIEVYRNAFRSAHRDIEIEFIQRKTTAAVAQLAGGDRLNADLFWASAPDAFELLKLEGLLLPLAPRDTGAPATVAGYPVNDPDGHYLGFALSAYGLAWNEAYLDRHRLLVPRSWRDLTAPIYAGHVGISSPSRSGTTHLVVEALLQSEGWEQGWRTWRQIGGNLATVTARSFGVSGGVARGRFGIGITIDFLAQPAGLDAGPVRFTVPDPEIFAPASIALLRQAQNREAADAFVDFLLSVAGQRLLLDPAVGRQPIRPEFYAEGRSDGPNPFQTADGADDWRFDAGRSAARYELINLMFDELVTFRLADSATIWRTVNEVEASLAQAPDEAAAKAATQARALLGAVPFSEAEAARIVEETRLARVPRGLQPPEAQAKLMARLRDWIGDNLAAAKAAAAGARTRLVTLGRLPEGETGTAAP
ncbi:extracellular solute-binding protein family 1 [Ancylobacter novellus DSM 506]|uniref:Extracellular solute-binding protein family 1 n=1 Tax=Ancylobacter novellus (strain ATCC 8093 / DSM 506 / JCM 20403 / CCM 1077 / IAM 12100 / NBRC 12443 / NCIMB 10456) TaxID=639283 RepID=D7A2N5_ANCN5|nr:extracellular solute-binding protein [Ancylobacter novellus]ADH91565.1 extracellular solute-binding protein family 1 [Ancylobacter novellus DSM 506]